MILLPVILSQRDFGFIFNLQRGKSKITVLLLKILSEMARLYKRSEKIQTLIVSWIFSDLFIVFSQSENFKG